MSQSTAICSKSITFPGITKFAGDFISPLLISVEDTARQTEKISLMHTALAANASPPWQVLLPRNR